ncbi:hypothetical protein DID78_06220 [Candidatus Marinamargulisbacteria bacterium SCGC AG-343-D04]|nr:hypothetical protein DID78_06220 [Candidatus Marinamargulisbacteria bacterium SCGC AG-343-D04]
MMKAVALCLLCWSSVFFATEPTIQVVVSPNQLNIGDLCDYSVHLYFDESYSLVSIPQKRDFKANADIEFNEHRVRKESENGRRYVHLEYSFYVFGVGDQVIPTQQVALKDQVSGDFDYLELPAQTIHVASVRQNDSFDVRLSSLFYIEKDLNWGGVLGIFFGVLLLVSAVVYSVYRWRQRPENVSEKTFVKDSRTPIRRALDELKDLFDSYEKMPVKDFYVLFSEIVKRYLSSVYSENVVEMTSYEIKQLVTNRLNEQDYRRLKHVLDFSDAIKFAQQVPSLKDSQDVYNKAVVCLEKIDHSFDDPSQGVRKG